MKRRHPSLIRLASIALVGVVVSCASAPVPIQVRGHPNALASLVGNWSGEYIGVESGRRGTISFALRAGDTTAFGDVLMIPRGFENHDVWTETTRHRAAPPAHPQVLTIMFVGVVNERVTGMIEPYTDPECDCQVLTAFTGRLSSWTTLEGTFLTRVPGTPRTQSGTWKVTRRPAR